MRKVLYTNLKKALVLALLFCGSNALSQNPAYQITSTVGGFVAPQMTQAQRTAITATSVKGTLVYQTDVTQGYYYYDGAAWKLINDATGLTGIIPVANGGTGISNIPLNNLIYGNGTSAVSLLAPSGTTGTILMNTAAGAPTWKTLTTLPATSGILPIANGGTNTSTIGAAGAVIYSTGTQQASTAVGTAGQFLVSNGAAAPGFGLLGQSAATAYGTAGGTLSSATGAGTFYTLPGLTQTITVPANAVVKISSDGGILAAVTGGNAFIDVAIQVDGAFPANGGYQRLTCPANTFAFWSFSEALTLSAMPHTIRIVAAWSSGNSATINGDGSSVLQGELTVTVIKQ
ncbi:MAG: hypothetical protein ABI402_06735 [Ferruginibacter sp.]